LDRWRVAGFDGDDDFGGFDDDQAIGAAAAEADPSKFCAECSKE
jgi:hypothetical protein